MSTLIETFIGPTFIILCFSFMLYGTFWAQAYYYFANYHDHLLLQCFVALIGLLETVHVALCIHVLYEYLIVAWGNLLASARIVPTVTALIYIEGIIISLVQAWYIYRIWRLRKQVIPVAFMCLLFCVSVGLALRETIYLGGYDLWLQLYGSKKLSTELNITYGFTVALEVSITSVLTFYLLNDRSKIVKRSLRKMIMSLVNFALSSGILIALTCCGTIVALNMSKESITFAGITQLMTKLHANSMLAALNARKAVSNASNSDTMFDVELSKLPPSNASDSTRDPM